MNGDRIMDVVMNASLSVVAVSCAAFLVLTVYMAFWHAFAEQCVR